MSPERIDGKTDLVDGRSDQFSLAVAAFLWMTGNYPFSGEGQVVMNRILREDPLTLSQVGPHGFAHLQPAFDKAFQKNPLNRFGTCTEFVTALT